MSSEFSDVVVLIPGISGSVLKKDGKEIWSLSGGAIIRSLLTMGESIKSLELTHDDPDVDDLGDGVTADRLIPDLHIIPGLWKVDGYSRVANYLVDACDLKRNENFFEFPYDWRRDNRASARRLASKAPGWLRDWKRNSGNPKAKLILVAHSMGGLVSRYFLEHLEGWRDTRMLVTFGTPFRGSLNALNFISNGQKKKVGPVTLLDLTNMLRSFTSVHQLLPIYPCVDMGDGNLLRVSESAKIPNLDPQRAADALKFHDDIQKAVENHKNDDTYLEKGYITRPIVGTFQETLQSAVLEGSSLKMLASHKGEDYGGDGTVPRVSAVPIGKQSHITGVSLKCPHGSLQNSEQALTQVDYWLKGIIIDDVKFKDVTGVAGVGLAVEDIYSTVEPIQIRVRCDDPSKDLNVSVQDVTTNEKVAHELVQPGDENWINVEFPSLEPQTYRLVVEGKGVRNIQDIFLVLEP